MTARLARCVLFLLLITSAQLLAQESLPNEAAQALRRAVDFYRTKVATHGGYVYKYSDDLSKREGEGKTDLDKVWVQPPGTPAVGMAYLEAYERTGESYLLEAARAAGLCLVKGQLRSGGWASWIEFAPEQRQKFAYRVDPPSKKRSSNVSTFDDNKSQSAMRLLIRLDKALNFKDEQIHESISFALDSVLKAQFPNGAWAQGFDSPVDPAKYPVTKAKYPTSWPKEFPGGNYWQFYTFNDDTIADTIEMLLMAAEVYDEPRYRESALRAGGFILLAQMPEPQPAWAQQYDFDMQPVWARKFEPPAISGGESQALIQTLMDLCVETGDRKWLEPIPRALDYLKRSTLPDGRLARFYELQSNRPLYLTRTYKLTYEDKDLPTHYGFKVSNKVEQLTKRYQSLSKATPQELAKLRRPRSRPSGGTPSDNEVRKVIASLEERGAWVEEGSLNYQDKDDNTTRIISSSTFIRNVTTLSKYLAKKR